MLQLVASVRRLHKDLLRAVERAPRAMTSTTFSMPTQTLCSIGLLSRSNNLPAFTALQPRGFVISLVAGALLLFGTGCSSLVANLAADALSGSGSAFSAEDDPDLVREAVPFGLKTIESLLESSPENTKLLLAAASGFTQYSYAYLQQDAAELEEKDPARSREILARAKKLYARAADYGFRGLESEHSGFRELFSKDRKAAIAKTDEDDVPLLYWTAAALAARIALSKDDMAAVGRLPDVEALMGRALELDESFSNGAIHEFYVTYDTTRSESAGGGLKKAKEHFDRALAISKSKKIAPFVTWAEVVAIQNQDRKLFDEMLDKALNFNADEEPCFRLENLIAKRRARFLKSRAGDLFLEEQ